MALRCAIVVRGRVPEPLPAMVDTLEVTDMDDERSLLAGEVPDHAALRGLLSNLDDLGYDLVSVETGDA